MGAKLRRIAQGENKHEFHDPKYAKEREESTSRVHDAMEKAFETAKPSTSSSKKGLWRTAVTKKTARVPIMPGSPRKRAFRRPSLFRCVRGFWCVFRIFAKRMPAKKKMYDVF